MSCVVPRLVSMVIILIVRAYSFLISPFIAPCCRFSPSCSQYAIQCFERHGVMKSIALVSRRLLSCHPFSSQEESS